MAGMGWRGWGVARAVVARSAVKRMVFMVMMVEIGFVFCDMLIRGISL